MSVYGGTLRGRSWRTAVLAACGVMVLGSRASADSIDFNVGPTDLTNNFNVDFDGAPVPTNGTAGSNFNWASGAGVADGGTSGGLTTTNTDATAVYVGPNHASTVTAYKLTSGASVAVMFMSQNFSANSDRIVQVGFENKFASSFNSDNGNGAVSAQQQAMSAATAFLSVRTYNTGQIEQQVKSNGAGTSNVTLRAADPIFPLIDAEWYKLTLNVTETATNSFSLLTTLDDYGTGGTSLQGNIYAQTTPSVVTVNGFNNSSNDLPAGDALGAVRQVLDNPQVDNFVLTGTSVQAPVPEPASLGLLAICGAGLLARRRSRRGGHIDR
jgi:hypothetical protein